MASSKKSKASLKTNKRIAVAFSGGLDSVVLLDTVCKSLQTGKANPTQTPTEVWAFHIHHGLQKSADQWLLFCEKLANKYKIHFDFRLLHLRDDKAQGNIEARARAGRYEALADLCIEHDITDLLLAHHQNDQAETVLLQLLRGAGVAGLSGMPVQRRLGTPAHSITAIKLERPLLNHSRQELEAYAKQHKLKWIEDPSNQDTRYRRNALRKHIIPRLEKIQPDAVANLARSAELMADAQTLLDRLAQQDGKSILKENTLSLKILQNLAQQDLPAANNLMRYWLKLNDLAMPSQERLQSWWKDLSGIKADAQLEWQHDGSSIRLWRGILQIAQAQTGQWIFKPVPTNSKAPGLPATFIKAAQEQGQIFMRERQGSEKIQIKPNSPHKSLKKLFQEADVPPWQRQVPLLYIGAELIAVAGVGVSYPHLVASGKRVAPVWA
jgi:tRNA(Ile)-lysidine synthase